MSSCRTNSTLIKSVKLLLFGLIEEQQPASTQTRRMERESADPSNQHLAQGAVAPPSLTHSLTPSLTVVGVVRRAVVARPRATFGLLQHVLVRVRSAVGGGLELLHHILELLQQIAQLQLQVCGKYDSSMRGEGGGVGWGGGKKTLFQWEREKKKWFGSSEVTVVGKKKGCWTPRGFVY